MKQRVIAALLFLSILASIHIPLYATGSLTDISSHWAKAYIEKVYEAQIIGGYPDQSFRPNKDVKRIEYLVMVLASQNIVARPPSTSEYWGAPYVEASLENGFITADEFGSSDYSVYELPITREEMASIIYKAFLASGGKVDQNSLDAAANKLTDFNTVKTAYLDAAISSVALGYITGFPNNTFGPKQSASRAQAAVILYNHMVKLNRIEPIVTVSNDGPRNTSYAVKGIEIGMTSAEVQSTLGTPLRKDDSAYAFVWWVYHDNYKNYLTVGIADNKVVALYTASPLVSSTLGLKMGQTKSEVNAILGDPLSSILKGKYEFIQINNSEMATYYKNNTYITTYFDVHTSGKLFSVFLVDKATEEALLSLYGNTTDAVRIAYENQIFDLTNVFRVERNLKPLQYSEAASNTARKHSKDMAIRNFFDHTNPSGAKPYDRLFADGIDHSLSAENIAAGYFNGFAAHSAWVNSMGHRNNLVRDVEFLGTGVYFGGAYGTYFTQNFFTP